MYDSATPWTAACQASQAFSICLGLLKLMSIESVMPSKHLILNHPLLLLLSIFPSIMVFSSESALHVRWPKFWSFSFNISPFNEYSGLISFRIDWDDLLAFQGNLKSLLQHHNLKTSIFQCSAFFMIQLSHLYLTLETIMCQTLCKVSRVPKIEGSRDLVLKDFSSDNSEQKCQQVIKNI